MESSLRPILPAKKLEEIPRSISMFGTLSSVKRQRILTPAACLICQKSKTKCDGVRPLCGRCSNKNLGCGWEFESGVTTRYAGLKAKNVQLEHDRMKHLRLLDRIQSAAPFEVFDLLASMRSDTDLTQAIREMNSETQPEPRSDRWMDEKDRADSGTSTGSSDALFTDGIVVEDISKNVTNLPKTMHEGHKAALIAGSNAFIRCTGPIFFVYTHEELDRIRQSVLEYFASSDQAETLTRSSDSNLVVPLAEMSIMSAVGLQYIEDSLPATDHTGSRKDKTSFHTDHLYQSAKMYLDEVIEANPLRAMKFCAILSMYNIITHSTVAVAYTEMGIKLGESQGLNNEGQTIGLSRAELVNYRRVFRTLVTLRSWLISTLGYIPSNQRSIQLGNNFNHQTEEVQVEEIIQQRMAAVTIIKSQFLCTVRSPTVPSPTILRQVREDLNRWHQELPRWMGLKALAEQRSGLSPEHERVVFFVHLFYLSAIILKGRIVHGAQDLRRLADDSIEMRIAVAEGIEASRSSARILDILLTRQSVFRKCWLCIFSSYMSGVMLLYAVTRRLQAQCPLDVWSMDHALVAKCLEVLKFCSASDDIARSFHANLKQAYDEVGQFIRLYKIEALLGESSSVVNITTPSLEDMFQPIRESSILSGTSSRLVRFLQQPFENFPNRPISKTMTSIEEVSVGAHVDWTIEIGPRSYNNMVPVRNLDQTTKSRRPSTPCAWGWSQD